MTLALCLAQVFLPGMAAAAAAKQAPKVDCPIAGVLAVTVDKVTDGDTFTDTTGTEIDLSGIGAPGTDGKTYPAAADAAKVALASALSGKQVAIALAGADKDRYGRKPAQVFVSGDWLQDILVRDGLAKVVPDAASASCVAPLLAAEAEARARHIGHWGDGLLDVMQATNLEDLRRRVGRFEIVEGVVVSAALVGGRAYLNFGDDRKTDFTATVEPDDMHNFPGGKKRIKALTGQRVRMRGWLENFNGPEISLARPEALELASDAPLAAKGIRLPRPKHKPRRPKLSTDLNLGPAKKQTARKISAPLAQP